MEVIRCFKALSDRTRLRLFYILHLYELNVNEIVFVIGMIQSGVSRHLRILVESGLLVSRKEGSYTYYSSVRGPVSADLIRMAETSDEIRASTSDQTRAREIMAIRQSSVRGFFRTVAPRWDQLKKKVLGDFDLDGEMIQDMDVEGVVADLGCGTGVLMEQIAKNTAHRIIGVDSSPEMLEQARTRLSARPNAELRLGELEHLPIRTGEIRAAFMNMVLHHLSRPEDPIGEAFRILQTGGTFIISDFDRHHQEQVKDMLGGPWFGFEKEKIHAWLIRAGFAIRKTASFPVRFGLTVHVIHAQKPETTGESKQT